MATQKFNYGIDLQGQGKVENLLDGTASTDAVNKGQVETSLSAKQDNLTDGAGIKLDGSTISVDLSTTEADLTSLTLSGASDSQLDGTYSKLPDPAYAFYKSGTDGDYDLRYNTGGFSWFYKDNGNGTWDVILAEDTDGSPNSNNQWSAFRVAINPTTVSGNVTDFILDSNSGLKFDITNGHDIDENTRKIPTATDSNVTYDEGSADSFLSFAGGKLKVDVVQLIGSAASTNLLSASATKTYIDEQDVISRSASSNSFSNTAPQYPNSPSNVQSALEAAKSLIDANGSAISGVQTVNTTQTSQIAAHSSVLGVSNGDSELPSFSPPSSVFLQTTAVNDVSITITGASRATFNDKVYTRVNTGYLNGSQNFVSDSTTGFFSYDAGGGTWYVLYKSNSNSNWVVMEDSTDPSTYTGGENVTGAFGELVANSLVDADQTVNGYIVPNINGALVGSQNDVETTTAPTNVVEALFGAAQNIGSVYSNIGGLLGLGQFDTDFGSGFTILPNNQDAKSLFEAIETELQTLATGAGATWAAGVVQSVESSNIADLSNPATAVFGGETLTQGQVFLAVGQTDLSENGFYVFDTTSTALVRWADADASADFIQNRSVQIVSDGTEWAYKGAADPTIDSTDLTFEKIRESIIADQSISEPKLTTALASKVNSKADVYGEVVTLVANTWKTITHNLDSLFVSVDTYLDSTGVAEEYERRIDNGNQISIRGTQAEDVRVVVVG